MAIENVTIDDIAEALGVSKTTVSRAMSGKGRISAETRARIRSYVEEINYKPNAVASGLARQKTFNIGVVCPTDYEIFDLQFFHRTLLGISEVAMMHEYDILISMIEGPELKHLHKIVENRKVDGIILTRTLFHDPPADYLKKSGIPFVVIGSSPDAELVQIDNDHVGACAELTSILIGKGMKRLALIGCDEEQVITDSRKRGFLLGHERAGIRPDPELIFLESDSDRRIEVILKSLLEKKADAAVCMDEKITSVLLEACRKKHVHIPEDLRVASFYNSTHLAQAVPAITAIDIDDRQLGISAASTLIDIINGGAPGSQHLKNYQILMRESTL